MRTGFGRSDHGVAFYDLLTDLGMTPTEWGELDIVEQRYLRSAHNEKSQREKEASENAG